GCVVCIIFVYDTSYFSYFLFFFFSSRRRHTRCLSDWSSDVCSSDLPRAVANDIPDWLEPYLAKLYGNRLETEMAALNASAPLDLRVNPLKADRDTARRALAAEHIDAEPTLWSPLGLRVAHRVPLAGTAAFKDGLVEVQDEGSQIAALLADARPGMRVVDFCAGAGGKTLALAAAMRNRGKLVA